ncbi:MAG TPA: YoaK family protein [Burkholderiaceae bacterium]|nr:YoaK family protein [Burkholderiaceae bacterium]
MFQFLRRLTGRERTLSANRQLGAVLAFVAGAINAGGFLAVHRYTSHMTGIVSAAADDLVLGHVRLALAGGALLASFILGAAVTALLANWARRRQMHSEYALSLLLEAALLVGFAMLGARLQEMEELLVPATVLLLCFVMGLQNAVVTKISRAQIRTTHVTGIVTDLGIELGRLVYWNRSPEHNARHLVIANRDKLRLHLLILGMFFAGAVFGAAAFKALGFLATLPFAAALVAMAAMPVLDDLRQRWRRAVPHRP